MKGFQVALVMMGILLVAALYTGMQTRSTSAMEGFQTVPAVPTFTATEKEALCKSMYETFDESCKTLGAMKRSFENLFNAGRGITNPSVSVSGYANILASNQINEYVRRVILSCDTVFIPNTNNTQNYSMNPVPPAGVLSCVDKNVLYS